MALSLSETKKVLDFVGEIKAAGKSAIFIDHNIFHVYPVAERIVVLDRGRVAGEFAKADITVEELIERLHHVAATGKLERKSAEP
jgi:simple sugar transport system ATP-binding protein